VLPLSDNVSESVGMGTRHRAALGISERSDAIAVAVSEERGTVSIVHNGQVVALLASDDREQIRDHLLSFFTRGRRRGDSKAAAVHG
jgi:diadenylate cyclase